ncbi:MAG: hypothetical protein MH186_03775 [Marinobacter sp.]|nr:hypothetical protein [Marinobacter sp.]
MLGRLSFPQPMAKPSAVQHLAVALPMALAVEAWFWALILAWGIPQLTQSFWPERPAVFKALAFTGLFAAGVMGHRYCQL